MGQEVYRQLLEVMKKRGGNYAGMDIPEFFSFVEELFTPQEAEVNNAMPRARFIGRPGLCPAYWNFNSCPEKPPTGKKGSPS